ncbi:ABC-type multidrug transport system, ATPase component [Lachnospiraceae bacterium NK3A20]|jgi:ABC-2 type transport system ATP-binding protein|nr:ABC-type multidrug transport system, ATPase component [Lachnospiraceae bacterium NK3A20]
MLQAEHLTKRFGKVLANNDLSFTIPEGTIAVMLGPNGAGKSTAMKSIMGLLRHEGSIRIDGMDTSTVGAKRLIGYVPEMPSLYPNLTVDEHLEFIARAYKLTDYKDYKEELLRRLQLDDKRKKFGDELSKGMQQKLSICIGLLPRPKFILFDEPMIGLDPHAIRELKNIFQELKAGGSSLLISTHIIDSVEGFWDQTLIMQSGRIVANVTHESLKASGETLEDLFFRLTEAGEEAT